MWKDLGSVATAASDGDVAGFPAIRAIVETVHAKADVVLAFADGAVFFADAALFR
jgi:NADPH-dependent ferric siderophore reductase